MEYNFKNLKEIVFNIKRAGFISIIFLFIIAILIGAIVYIEGNLKITTGGLSAELDTISPIFYGIVSLFALVFYSFVLYYIFITQKKFKNDIESFTKIKLLFYLSYFLPTIFCFIIVKIINNYITPNKEVKTKKKKFVKKEKETKIPYNIIIEPNQAYQDNDGVWWYKDNDNNYYKADENNNWVKVS